MNVSFSIILVSSQAPHPLLTPDQPQSTNEQEFLQGYLDMFHHLHLIILNLYNYNIIIIMLILGMFLCLVVKHNVIFFNHSL